MVAFSKFSLLHFSSVPRANAICNSVCYYKGSQSLLLRFPCICCAFPAPLQRVIKRVSFDCRKTKTKVITLTNHKRHRKSSKPITTRSKYILLARSAENVRERVTIGFGFTSDWLKKWRKFFKPITKRSNAKPKQTRITFDTQVKTALPYYNSVRDRKFYAGHIRYTVHSPIHFPDFLIYTGQCDLT